jgi:hypothetical protein
MNVLLSPLFDWSSISIAEQAEIQDLIACLHPELV